MIFARFRLLSPKTCISTPLNHQIIAFLDHVRNFRATAPPANPQINQFHEISLFWDGRFYSGGNYAVPDSVQKNSQPEGVAIDRKGIVMRAAHAQKRSKCNFCTHAALTLQRFIQNFTVSIFQIHSKCTAGVYCGSVPNWKVQNSRLFGHTPPLPLHRIAESSRFGLLSQCGSPRSPPS